MSAVVYMAITGQVLGGDQRFLALMGSLVFMALCWAVMVAYELWPSPAPGGKEVTPLARPEEPSASDLTKTPRRGSSASTKWAAECDELEDWL